MSEASPIQIIKMEDLGLVNGEYRSRYILSTGQELNVVTNQKIADSCKSPAVYRLENDQLALNKAGVSDEAIDSFVARLFEEGK